MDHQLNLFGTVQELADEDLFPWICWASTIRLQAAGIWTWEDLRYQCFTRPLLVAERTSHAEYTRIWKEIHGPHNTPENSTVHPEPAARFHRVQLR